MTDPVRIRFEAEGEKEVVQAAEEISRSLELLSEREVALSKHKAAVLDVSRRLAAAQQSDLIPAIELTGSKFSRAARLSQYMVSGLLREVNPAIGQMSSSFAMATRYAGAFGLQFAAISGGMAAAVASIYSYISAVKDAAAGNVKFKELSEGSFDAVASEVRSLTNDLEKDREEQSIYMETVIGTVITSVKSIWGVGTAIKEANLARAQQLMFEKSVTENLKVEMNLRGQLLDLARRSADIRIQEARSEGELRKAFEARGALEERKFELEIEKLKQKEMEVRKRYEKYPVAMAIQLKGLGAELEILEAQRGVRIVNNMREIAQAEYALRRRNIEDEIHQEQVKNTLLTAISEDYFARKRARVIQEDLSAAEQAEKMADLDLRQARFVFEQKIKMIDQEIAQKTRLHAEAVHDANVRIQLEQQIAALGAQRVVSEKEYNSQVLQSRQQLREQLRAEAEKERGVGGGLVGQVIQEMRAAGYQSFTERDIQTWITGRQSQVREIAQRAAWGGTVGMEEWSLLQSWAGLLGQAGQLGPGMLGSPGAAVTPYLSGLFRQAWGLRPDQRPSAFHPDPDLFGGPLRLSDEPFERLRGNLESTLEGATERISDILNMVFKKFLDHLVRTLQFEAERQ